MFVFDETKIETHRFADMMAKVQIGVIAAVFRKTFQCLALNLVEPPHVEQVKGDGDLFGQRGVYGAGLA